jgi:hypothetical protein
MRTFEVTIDETALNSNPLQMLKEIKGVMLVTEKSPLLTSKDWVRPGVPATDAQIIQSVEEAESSVKFFTTEELRLSLQERYKGA